MREGWVRVWGARRAEGLLPLSTSPRKLRLRANGADMTTTVVFSIQHAGSAKLEEIVVEVHPEWAPIGAQCVRPARTT